MRSRLLKGTGTIKELRQDAFKMPNRCQEDVWNGGGGDRGRREEVGRSTPGATTSLPPSLLPLPPLPTLTSKCRRTFPLPRMWATHGTLSISMAASG